MNHIPSIEGYEFFNKIYATAHMETWIVKEVKTNRCPVVTILFNFTNSQKNCKNLEMLIEKQKHLNHPSVAAPYKYYIPHDGKTSVIIFYNCNAVTSLSSRLKKHASNGNDTTISLHQVFVFTLATIAAIEYLHSNDIVIYDITSKLIILDTNNTPMLVSYGLFPIYFLDTADSRFLESVTSAPELKADFKPTEKSDIFSFGMFIYSVYTPKNFANSELLFRRLLDISRRGYQASVSECIPGFLAAILIQCWSTDPNQRPKAKSIFYRVYSNIESYTRGSTEKAFQEYAPKLVNYEPLYINKEMASIANDVPILSKKGKKIAYKYILLQETILAVSSKTIGLTFKLIKDIIKPSKDKNHLISFFLTATQCRFLTIKEIADLFHMLTKQIPHFDDLPLIFLQTLVRSIIYIEPVPDYVGAFQFLFFLYDMGDLKSKELMTEFKYLYDRTPNRNNICLPFCWFANLFFESDRPLYETISSILLSHQNDDFFPELYRNFIKNFKTYKAKNFAFYKEKLPKNRSMSKLRQSIKTDSAKEFVSMTTGNKNDLYSIEADIFEPCPFIKEETYVQVYIALYGANAIWYGMLTKHPLGLPKEKVLRKFMQFCIAGGSESIIMNAMQLRCQMDGSPQIATVYHRNEIFTNFLMNFCDLTLPDKDGKLVITTAAASNNIYILLTCLQMGMSINSREPFGYTPLHSAAAKGMVEVMEVLFQIQGVDVNAKDIWGCTPLHVATDRSQLSAVKVLLNNRNVKPNLMNEDGKTPFIMAVESGDIEIIKLFMTSSIKKTSTTTKGLTALHIAATKSLDVFELIAKKSGIDYAAVDSKGRTALDIAKKCNNKPVIDAIENYIAKSGQKCYIA